MTWGEGHLRALCPCCPNPCPHNLVFISFFDSSWTWVLLIWDLCSMRRSVSHGLLLCIQQNLGWLHHISLQGFLKSWQPCQGGTENNGQTGTFFPLWIAYLKTKSGFRAHHSRDRIVNVNSDLLMASDRGFVCILVLLDLCATFDTIDLHILLHRLEHLIGSTGLALRPALVCDH